MASLPAHASESGAGRLRGLSAAAWASVCLPALSALAFIPAVYYMLTGFAVWDDEGTMMMSVKEYLEGSKLYSELATAYGPVYYFYNRLVHGITGIPVSHDFTRLASAVLLVLCALISAWIVYRLTRSIPIAAATHVTAYGSLWFFHNEPGHPQELCMLLLLLFVGAALWASDAGRRRVGMVLMGAIAAALLLIKVNIGIFAIAAAGLTIVYSLPRSAPVRLLRIAAGAAALAMPFLLMRVHLNSAPEARYCLVVTAGVAALVLGPLRKARPSLTFRDAWIALGSFAVTAAAVLLALMAQGTTLRSALGELVLANLKLNVNLPYWFLPEAVGRVWVPWALAGVVAAAAVTLGIGSAAGRIPWLIPVFKAWFGVATLVLAWWGRWAIPFGAIVGFAAPFCWLLLVAPDAEEAAFSRAFLAGTAVLQTLYAYPLAGSQSVFLRVPLIIVGAISLSDGLQWLAAARLWEGRARRLIRWAEAGALILVLVCYPLMGYRAKRAYGAAPSLGLPGARLIHLPEQQALVYRWLASNLRQYCDAFVGMPGLPSLYFWTGQEPPGPLHERPGRLWADDWLYGFSNEEQLATVRDFARYPNACTVHSSELVSFWNKGNVDLSKLPLVHYIDTEFSPAGQMGGFDFMIRKGRRLQPVPAK